MGITNHRRVPPSPRKRGEGWGEGLNLCTPASVIALAMSLLPLSASGTLSPLHGARFGDRNDEGAVALIILGVDYLAVAAKSASIEITKGRLSRL